MTRTRDELDKADQTLHRLEWVWQIYHQTSKP
jgi:hypothetical protein